MSTKIYSGFRFVPSDLNEVHTLLSLYRSEVKDAVHEAKCRFLAGAAADHIDKAALKGEPAGEPLGAAHDEMRRRQKEVRTTGYRDPEVDFDFKLSVMPYGECVYGIVFCEQRAWQSAFLAQPWVEHWPYWNSTDRPEGVSRREWAKRGETWNAILAGDEWDRPVGCGFGYDFEPPPRWPQGEDVLAYVPSHADRVARFASMRVMDAEFRRLLDEAGVSLQARECMQYVIQAEQNVRGPKGDHLRRAEGERIAPLLPAITLDVLLGWSPSTAAA
ncbi:hypothetical protein LPLAFNJD_LOCUS751 [Methylorubrum aminovorans]